MLNRCFMRLFLVLAIVGAGTQSLAAEEASVTVKTRTGIVLRDAPILYSNLDFLMRLVDTLVDAGCQRLYLHARVAVLGGLSPAQNRDIPPLTPEKGRSDQITAPGPRADS